MRQRQNRGYSRRFRGRGGFSWQKLLLILLSVLLAYSTIRLAVYVIHSRSNRKTNEELSEIFEAQTEDAGTEAEIGEMIEEQAEDSPEEIGELFEEQTEDAAEAVTEEIMEETAAENGILDEYQLVLSQIAPSAEALYKINPDVVAWLNIPGVMELPVVYRDNTYYLNHNFYGKKSGAGTLFLDENHPFQAQTQYLMIHGHSMNDGSMFGYLTHYRDMDYIKAHPKLTLTTLYARDTYRIIGTLYVEEGEMTSVAGLGRPCFADAEEFHQFIHTFRMNAMEFTKEAVTPDTALLALSTCYRTGRIVVLFKRTASEPL